MGELPDSSALGAEYGLATHGVILSASSFYINQTIPKGSIPSGSVTLAPVLFSVYSDLPCRSKKFGSLTFNLGGGIGWGFTGFELGKDQEYLNNKVERVLTEIDDDLIFHFKFGVFKNYERVSVGLDFNYIFFNPKFTTTRINSTTQRRYVQNDYLDFSGLTGGLTARFQ